MLTGQKWELWHTGFEGNHSLLYAKKSIGSKSLVRCSSIRTPKNFTESVLWINCLPTLTSAYSVSCFQGDSEENKTCKETLAGLL